jgi:hypothetical protein
MRTLNRSFGFPFRKLMFGCTLLKHDDGKDDAYVFYDGKEYESLQLFFDSIKPTQIEQESLLETLNKLIKQP